MCPARVCDALAGVREYMEQWKLQGVFSFSMGCSHLSSIAAPNALRLCFLYLKQIIAKLSSHIGLVTDDIESLA